MKRVVLGMVLLGAIAAAAPAEPTADWNTAHPMRNEVVFQQGTDGYEACTGTQNAPGNMKLWDDNPKSKSWPGPPTRQKVTFGDLNSRIPREAKIVSATLEHLLLLPVQDGQRAYAVSASLPMLQRRSMPPDMHPDLSVRAYAAREYGALLRSTAAHAAPGISPLRA